MDFSVIIPLIIASLEGKTYLQLMTLKEIIHQINEVYDGEPWYGNSIQAYLQEIDPDIISKRMNHGHSVGQILAHMIVWRNFAIGKLQGKDVKVELNSSEDWANQEFTAEHKAELYKQLQNTQETLNRLLSDKNDDLLLRPVPGERVNFQTLLTGLVQHDIYHLGQMYLLKSSQ